MSGSWVLARSAARSGAFGTRASLFKPKHLPETASLWQREGKSGSGDSSRSGTRASGSGVELATVVADRLRATGPVGCGPPRSYPRRRRRSSVRPTGPRQRPCPPKQQLMHHKTAVARSPHRVWSPSIALTLGWRGARVGLTGIRAWGVCCVAAAHGSRRHSPRLQ